MRLNHLSWIFALSVCLVSVASADPPPQMVVHASTWENLPEIIDSITETSYREQLEELHALTRIKLGYPQAALCLSDSEHEQYMLRTKQHWQQWWKSTGEPISKEKEEHAKVDQAAFDMAWEFLGTKKKRPEVIVPVWIPATWVLYVTFTNGDYFGRAREVWIIERGVSNASLTKLRGDYFSNPSQVANDEPWNVTLKEFSGFTPENADQVLKALHYLHRYAPESDEDLPENFMEGLYYPHSTIQLRDGANRVVWNTEGYEFCKTRPEYGDGDSGRTFYFLRTKFSDEEKWKVVSESASAKLAPYHTFLSMSKPYFASNAADVIQLFGQQGGVPELQEMLTWADKERAATNPQMGWDACADDFGAGGKDNVISFNRYALQETLKQINKAGIRLKEAQKSGQDATDDAIAACLIKEKELQGFVTDMLALERMEKEKAIVRYPLPLRDLIRVDELPDDSELKHLSAAIQAIRNNPDPKLFTQLVQEMHEGTLRIRHLLEYILVKEQRFLDVKPWEKEQEAIAVDACIDALPLANDDAKQDLVEILLRVCGGGRIEFETKGGGRSVDLSVTENGYSTSLGASYLPPSLASAQNKLRRLYKNSRAEKEAASDVD